MAILVDDGVIIFSYNCVLGINSSFCFRVIFTDMSFSSFSQPTNSSRGRFIRFDIVFTRYIWILHILITASFINLTYRNTF